MDQRVEILNQIRSFAPKEFEEWQIDYIIEAMQRYADFWLSQNKKECQKD